jgi:hypothetical protein
MSQIGISFTPNAGSPVYNIVIDNFDSTDMPRSYQESAAFSRSINGTNILTGSAFRQKYMWVISTMMTKADALEFDAMFQAWDLDRAAGLAVAVGVSDATWGPTVNTSAVISTPPSYVRVSPTHTVVSFGMMEV